MKIQKLCNQKGAVRFGNCNECGKGSKDDPDMVRIFFQSRTSICLCNKCLNRFIQDIMIFDEVFL